MICPLCFKSQNLTVISGPDDRLFRNCSHCKLNFTNTKLKRSEISVAKQNNKVAKSSKLMKKLLETVNFSGERGGKAICIGTKVGVDFQNALQKTGYDFDFEETNYISSGSEPAYDLVMAIGTFEDFFFPAKEVDQITNLLAPEGILIIVTDLWQNLEQFSKWTFAKNPHHVSFFHEDTFNYVCEKYGFKKLSFEEGRIMVLEKLSPADEAVVLEIEMAEIN